MIRLALVGCGRNAAALAAAAAASDFCELKVAADIDPKAAGDLARSAGARPHVGDLDSLLEADADDVQAIVVNTPNDSHADIALEGHRRGPPRPG